MALLSVVLPVHNEAKILQNNFVILNRHLKKLGIRYEIIIAEDGSTDGTDGIARRIVNNNRNIRSIHSKTKLGRGLALKRAFSIASGEILCYIDTDLSPHPKHFKDLVKYTKDFDVVIGSRYMKASEVKRPFMRDIAAKMYNWTLRRAFSCDIHDFQCGFKIFSRRFFQDEIMNIKEKSWAWDTTVLIEAVKKGYKVKEVPIKWMEKKEAAHSASFKRLAKDFYMHGKVLVKLFAKWNLGMKISV